MEECEVCIYPDPEEWELLDSLGIQGSLTQAHINVKISKVNSGKEVQLRGTSEIIDAVKKHIRKFKKSLKTKAVAFDENIMEDTNLLTKLLITDEGCINRKLRKYFNDMLKTKVKTSCYVDIIKDKMSNLTSVCIVYATLTSSADATDLDLQKVERLIKQSLGRNTMRDKVFQLVRDGVVEEESLGLLVTENCTDNWIVLGTTKAIEKLNQLIVQRNNNVKALNVTFTAPRLFTLYVTSVGKDAFEKCAKVFEVDANLDSCTRELSVKGKQENIERFMVGLTSWFCTKNTAVKMSFWRNLSDHEKLLQVAKDSMCCLLETKSEQSPVDNKQLITWRCHNKQKALTLYQGSPMESGGKHIILLTDYLFNPFSQIQDGIVGKCHYA